MPRRVRKKAKIGISKVSAKAISNLAENARYSLMRMVGVTPILSYWREKEGVADLEHDGPAEISAGDKK